MKKLFYFLASVFVLFSIGLAVIHLFLPWYEQRKIDKHYVGLYRSSLDYNFTCETSEDDCTLKRIIEACEKSSGQEIKLRELMLATGYPLDEANKLLYHTAISFCKSKEKEAKEDFELYGLEVIKEQLNKS